jgi:hypothetical protein
MLYLHHQYESKPGPLMDISTIKILSLNNYKFGNYVDFIYLIEIKDTIDTARLFYTLTYISK